MSASADYCANLFSYIACIKLLSLNVKKPINHTEAIDGLTMNNSMLVRY